MNRRTIVLSAALTIALVLGFQLGMPKITQAVANATPTSIDTMPATVANAMTTSINITPTVVTNATTTSIGITPTVASSVPPSIDTTPYWNGVDFISSFGMTNTATYGQIISMTESAALTQFSFFMKAQTTTIFRGYVFGWDGSRATGAPLFESAPKSTLQSAQFEEVIFYIPAEVALKAGHQYVLFASTSKDPAQPPDTGRWGAVTNTAYAGGQFVFTNNYTDTSKWTGAAWSTIAADLAFKATLVRPASIDTTPYWNRADYISSFGMPNTATYGQTISMTESAKLTQFSFFIEVTPTTIFRGYVFGWDGSKATGAPLFTSAPMNTRGAYFQEVVFDIPDGIALKAGHQYVLFASTSKDPAQPPDAGKWGSVANTVYNGGQFVYLNNGADSSLWMSTPWSTITQDLAFRAALQYQLFLPLIMRQ
jgi:hypothetical protein